MNDEFIQNENTISFEELYSNAYELTYENALVLLNANSNHPNAKNKISIEDFRMTRFSFNEWKTFIKRRNKFIRLERIPEEFDQLPIQKILRDPLIPFTCTITGCTVVTFDDRIQRADWIWKKWLKSPEGKKFLNNEYQLAHRNKKRSEYDNEISFIRSQKRKLDRRMKEIRELMVKEKYSA